MNSTKIFGYDRPELTTGFSALWTVLISGSGLFLSTVFACATPFAALATLAALKFSRRRAIIVIGLIWFANQAIGYGVLGYPRTWDSAAWGLAIGVSAAMAVLAARGLSTTRPAPLAVSLPFVAAFAAFELGLYIAGFALPGNDSAFSASVVRHVFLINAVTICALMTAYHAVIMLVYFTRSRPSESGQLGAAL